MAMRRKCNLVGDGSTGLLSLAACSLSVHGGTAVRPMTDYLDTAVRERWQLKIKCERRREGLKSARPCPMPSLVDVNSLLAVLKPSLALDELRTIIHCPRCGSEHVSLTWIVPAGPPAKSSVPPKMQPVGPGEIDLGRYSGPFVAVSCLRCRRQGRYNTAVLRERLGPDTFMTEVAQRVAESRGCRLARADLLSSKVEARGCGAHLDVQSGPWSDD